MLEAQEPGTIAFQNHDFNLLKSTVTEHNFQG